MTSECSRAATATSTAPHTASTACSPLATKSRRPHQAPTSEMTTAYAAKTNARLMASGPSSIMRILSTPQCAVAPRGFPFSAIPQVTCHWLSALLRRGRESVGGGLRAGLARLGFVFRRATGHDLLRLQRAVDVVALDDDVAPLGKHVGDD